MDNSPIMCCMYVFRTQITEMTYGYPHTRFRLFSPVRNEGQDIPDIEVSNHSLR